MSFGMQARLRVCPARLKGSDNVSTALRDSKKVGKLAYKQVKPVATTAQRFPRKPIAQHSNERETHGFDRSK